MPTLPQGTVTFLFSDIEGSTRLLPRLGDRYAAAASAAGRAMSLPQAIAYAAEAPGSVRQ